MKTIILDTDLGGDCDDVMALDLILSAHKAGECRLVGVTYSSDAKNAIPCIYAILKQHGLNDIPIGTCPIADGIKVRGDVYATAVAEAFPWPERPTYETVPRAVPLLRKLLTENEKVTIITTGFMTNLAQLLKEEQELVRKHVEEIVIMGCNFSHQTGINPRDKQLMENGDVRPWLECNIDSDIPAAQYAFAHFPVPVTICPFEVGYKMISGKPMREHGNGKTPDSMSFTVHGSINGRDSFDPATALYGIYGTKPWFYRSAPGNITITDDALTHFYPDENGKFRIIECAMTPQEIASDIDKLVMRLFD